MDIQYKPAGYTSASPYFIVNGAHRLITLLDEIFGVEVLRKFDKEDGTIMHAEVRLDDTVLMMGDAGDTFTPNTYWMHVYVPDVHGTFQKALHAGCISVETPNLKDGEIDIRGTFQDFAGNKWSIATQT